MSPVKPSTLVKAAWIARDRSYSPYSNFKVGSAIETASGQIFTGCNVEIANFGCSLCAERNAIFKAVSEGALKPGELMTVAVAAVAPAPVTPCGSCRQVIEEFAGKQTRVLVSREPGQIELDLAHRELLPYSFNSDHLASEKDPDA